MATDKINGHHLARMLENGLCKLRLYTDEVNKLNVFPVADGDTGTNMSLTLGNGLRSATEDEDLGKFLRPVSEGMLLGARGNSGVILSQLFKGLYLELKDSAKAGAPELCAAFIRAYKTAYASVIKPVEGTILTVSREGIEHIKDQTDASTTVEALLSMYVAEMKKSLNFTPELLPVLKEAGVVDSGAYGYILIAEGMLEELYGKHYEKRTPEQAITEPSRTPLDMSGFDENSEFADGYCMEFILQLMLSDKYNQRFNTKKYIEDIQRYGTSLVVVQDGARVKVHIHTHKPAKIITISQEFGEFLTFKLENMQLQHNEVLRGEPPKKHKKLAVIAAVSGEGMERVFRDLGCDTVINCQGGANASTEDFLSALERVSADRIVVLPNNKNVIMAAEQAVRLAEAANVTVLQTKSPAEGYFALAMDIPDSDDSEYRLRQMISGMSSTKTLTEAVATKAYSGGDVSCRAGECVVIYDGTPVAASTDWCECIINGLRCVDGVDDSESCVIFRGAGVPASYGGVLLDRLSENFPMLEATVLDGGQSVYDFIIGISL